jgi:hypothetical protein
MVRQLIFQKQDFAHQLIQTYFAVNTQTLWKNKIVKNIQAGQFWENFIGILKAEFKVCLKIMYIWE